MCFKALNTTTDYWKRFIYHKSQGYIVPDGQTKCLITRDCPSEGVDKPLLELGPVETAYPANI